MCGRYATARGSAELGRIFAADDLADALAASWNVAPTDPVPVVRESRSAGARVVQTARWGLVPPWSADARGGARMINARAETVATSRAYAPSFARRRCLVPADGWYEWTRADGRRQAWYLTPADGSVLALAGLTAVWGPPDATLLTCSIVTTAALGPLRAVHERMPLLLAPDRWDDWLAGGGDPAGLLAPPTAAELAAIELRPVGPAVGSVRSHGPQLTERVEAPAAEPTLF